MLQFYPPLVFWAAVEHVGATLKHLRISSPVTNWNISRPDSWYRSSGVQDDSAQTKLAAAFLETRRYGAMLGGTTEWSKLEGAHWSVTPSLIRP